MRKNSQALAPYYQRTAFLRDADFLELAESLIGGLEACVSFELPLNSSLLNQWTDYPLQLSGLYTPPLQSYPIASGIDIVNNSGSMYQSVSPAKIPIELPVKEPTPPQSNMPISIPKPLQTNEIFCASIHNSPFLESHLMNRKSTLKSTTHACVEELEEPKNVDVGVDCFSEVIDDDVEHDVQLTALLSRVDAMINKNEPNNSNVAHTEENNENIQSENRNIVIETEEVNQNQMNSSLTTSGNSLISRMGWFSTDNHNDTKDNLTANTESHTSAQSTSRPLSRSNSLNSSIKSPTDRFSYSSLLRHGVKRAEEGSELYSRQIDFSDIWQRFESTLGISHSTAVNNDGLSENTSHMSSAGKNKSSNGDSDEDGLIDFEFIQNDSLAMQFSISELREMVQQTFKIPRETGLDSQNFACISCGNPLGVGGSGNTTTQ